MECAVCTSRQLPVEYLFLSKVLAVTDSPRIFLKKAEYQRILPGSPWIYSNQLDTHATSLKDFEPGQEVSLYYQERWLARGYINPHSLICFRALTFNPDETIDAVWITQRLRQASSLRESYFNEPFYRLVHAEGDFLPGFVIDRYHDVFVVQLNTAGAERLSQWVIEALYALFSPKSILIKRDSASRLLEGLSTQENEWIGEPIEKCIIQENGAKYVVNFTVGQKTGWFFDQRMNRQHIASLCKNKRVLDYYSYAGGFSILAAVMGAEQVTAIDRSEHALSLASESAELNGVASRTTFVCAEVFADIEQRVQANERYDVVIVDPPAFIKSKKEKTQGIKGYQKLFSNVLPLVEAGGYLFMASCSHHLTLEELKNGLAVALSKNGRQGQIMEVMQAGWDHPVNAFLPQTEYLKGLLVRIGV